MTTLDERREEAIERLEAKRDFRTHMVVYVLVNALLIGIWALSGAGFFWPIFVIFGWGVGVVLNAYDVYIKKPITEDEIQAEMHRSDPSGTTL